MSNVDQEAMLDALRTERNRFFAFAFAAADLVLEVGADGAIAYAAGAGRELLGVKVEQPRGKNFFSLLNVDDRAAVHATLTAVDVGARSIPLSTHTVDDEGSARDLDLRAYRPTGTSGAIFVTIRRGNSSDKLAPASRALRGPAAVPDVARFARAVSRRIGTVQAGDTPLALTLIALDNFAESGGEKSWPLMSTVADLARL